MAETALIRKARPREPWESVTLGELRDGERFDAFVRSGYARMLSLARQFAGSLEDADDAVQKAFLELHEVVTGRLLEPQALAVGFMVERVRWRAYDTLRDRRRQPMSGVDAMRPAALDPPRFPDGDGVAAGHPLGAGAMPELADLLVALEKSEEIHRMGGELAGRRREVFDLLTRDQRPVDIARQLGITKARVSQLVQIVCSQLRTKLRDRGWECNETIGVPLNSWPESTLNR
jgi:RNA polymerase sigma factor (sigma-70 family)